MTITLPRRSTSVPIAGSLVATPNFNQDLETLTQAIEVALNNINDTVASIAVAQQQIAAAQQQIIQVQGQTAAVATVANAASSTAAQANQTANPGAPQRQATSTVTTVDLGAFNTVASVTFGSAVAVSGVALGDSGPTGGTVTGTGSSPHNGSVQILRNGTVVAGPVPYSVDIDGSLTYAGFSALGADATTGSVVYQLQAKKVSGQNGSIAFLLDVTRTP